MKRGLLSLLGVLAALVFQEVLFRLVFVLPEIEGFNRIDYMPVAPGGSKIRAVRCIKVVVESHPDGVKSIETLNEYGFRDGRWSAAKRDGMSRIFLVGDSFVEGAGARDSETISRVLQSRAGALGEGLEAMNLGAAGSNMPRYLRLISDAVPVFRPDAVMLFLYANDLPDNPEFPTPRHFERFATAKPRILELCEMLARQEQLPYRWAWRHVHFDQPVPSPSNPWSNKAYLERNVGQVEPGILMAMKQGRFNPWRVGGARYLEGPLRQTFDISPALAALDSYLRSYGARLAVMYIPERGTVTNYYKRYERLYSQLFDDIDMTQEQYQLHRKLLREQCDGLAIPFLDLYGLIKREEDAGRHVFRNFDDHLTPAGYHLVGTAVWDWWSAQRIVAPNGVAR